MKKYLYVFLLALLLFAHGSYGIPPIPPTGGGGGSPTGTASGDLSGTYPAPTVALIHLANPSTSTTGIIYKGVLPFIHNYVDPTSDVNQNTFMGLNSGNFTMGPGGSNSYFGTRNSGFGFQTLHALTTGYENTAVGNQALYYDTTGYGNTGIGHAALANNLVGTANCAVGDGAACLNISGVNNTAMGEHSLYWNTTSNENAAFGNGALSNATGGGNTSMGYASLLNITTGANDVALGRYAGMCIADNSTPNVTSGTSTYLGAYTLANANGDTNETVIGYGAIGHGSNTVTLGNSSVTDTYLIGTIHGNVGGVSGGTQYYIPYWTSSSTLGSLSALGTAGWVLTSQGPGAAPIWAAASGGFSNPMTTLGDIIVENATPAAARLAGNTTATRKFLRSVGSGGLATALVWDTLQAGDIPDISATYLPLHGNADTATSATSATSATTAANLSGTPTLPTGTTLVAPVLGTPASGNLSSCTNIPVNQATGILPLANETLTTPFYNGLQRGANLAPAFAAAYTVSHWTEGGGSMAINYTGANSYVPATPLTITAGYVYEVDVVMSAYTSGTFTVSLGGFTSPVITPTATGKYVIYALASSTANLSISAAASGAQVMTMASVTVMTCGVPNTNISMIIDTNSGDAVTRTVYLPVASVGLQFCEYVIAAYAVVLKSGNGSDSFYLGTTAYTTSLTLGTTRQTFISLGSYVVNVWDLLGLNGSVTGA